jgi:exodeoxyribonuclease V beta subunit
MELLLEKMLVDPSLEALESWITGQKQWFGTVAETDEPPIIEQKNLKVELELPPEVMVEDRSRTILSFTALIRGKTAGGSFSSPSVHSLSEERNSHTLPAGAAIGTMLHNIFEAIPWGETATEWLEGSVGSKLLGEWHEWKEVIAEMIDSALQASLGGWSLSDVGADAIVREMEFLYPSQDDFIKGYIDAVVYAEGRYWILDWKSNKLGENSEAYCQAAVQQAMEKHRYPLQAALYAEALRRHLALTDPRPFEECFGGAYYLFLRGLGTDGIAFLSPEALAKSLD